MKHTWHILGPGAIGSLFACALQQAGLAVSLIPRRPQSINTHTTLLLCTPEGEHPYTLPLDDGHAPIHQLLITVKAHQTRDALMPLANRLAGDAVIVLMQNGMGAWEDVLDLCPSATLLLATTTEGANRPQADRVVHAGLGDTWIGPLQPEHATQADQVYQQWQPALPRLHRDTTIHARLWQKLAINCAINPLTVLYDCPNGELLSNDEAMATMAAVCNEVEQVMSRALNQPPGDVFTVAKDVAHKTGRNISSMLQDVRRGQATEIDYITGYLLRRAEEWNIPCPHNRALYQRITRWS